MHPVRTLSQFAAILACFACLGCAGPAHADEPANIKRPQTTTQAIELSVPPAAEPRPALKYHLLPWTSERTPGNAAQFYYRAILSLRLHDKEYWQKYHDNHDAWLSSDERQFPRQDVADWLAAQGTALAELKVATHREYCDWDYRIQDLRGMDTINFLLPEVQQSRDLGRVIQLRAHLELMDGRVDDAFATLGLGYQLAHDVARTPFIVNNLVGVAIAGIMNAELPLLFERSDANYYWAIRSLPQPLIDLRTALQFEMNSPAQLFPYLKDPETADHTPDEWRRLVVGTIANLENLAGGGSARPDWQSELIAAAMMTKLYPVAKAALIESGLGRERVEAMPVAQVVAIHTSRATQYAFQEAFKLALLPYDEAMRRLPIVAQRLKKDIVTPEAVFSGQAGIPIVSILLPSVQAVLRAEVRLVRDLAALAAIEAIRMHAAETGKLPAALAEITVVPVPTNPATGQPFPYKLDAASGTATLEAPQIEAPQEARQYVIRLRK
jgi:hypothetical protein